MLSLRHVASEFSAPLNRPVEYVEIEFEQFREALTRQMPDNPTAVTHLSILWGQILQEPFAQGLKRAGEHTGGMDEMLEVIPRIVGVVPRASELCARTLRQGRRIIRSAAGASLDRAAEVACDQNRAEYRCPREGKSTGRNNGLRVTSQSDRSSLTITSL
jgi:hypothetical protein